MQIIAVGGNTSAAPSHSRRAIQTCIEDSIEWVELDVRCSRDGQHLLFPADRLDHKSNGHGNISANTLEELQQLDCGSWFAKRFSRNKIFTLAECLELAKEKINLYLHCQDVNPISLAQQIQAAGMQTQVVLLVNDEQHATLRNAGIDKIATARRWTSPANAEAWLATHQPTIVELDAAQITAELVDLFHTQGVLVKANTTHEPETTNPSDAAKTWERLQALHVDLLATSVPEEALVHLLHARFGKSRPTQIAIHRGASRYAPENTLPAMEKAARLHADYVEIDVRTSNDGQCFLLHDGNLDRTTNAKGPLSALSSRELLALDAGSWFAEHYRDLRIPTLDEFLATVGPDTQIYFDAKSISPETLVEALSKHQLLDRAVVYQSVDYLARLKQLEPRVRRMPSARSAEEVTTLAQSIQPYAVDTPWLKLSKAYVDHCHALGIKVFADSNPLVSVQGYQNAMSLGVDLIQTDSPLRLWRAIELREAQ